MVGSTVSHYNITEKLGAGGMGVVYKAEDTKLKRVVALKFLPPDLTRDEEAKNRFIHEAQAASTLDHPNICNIHEINETEDGQIFIAMTCYEGESLKDMLDKGPLPVETSLDIACQIARGLEKAHAEGIVHRDINSANIFVTKEGQVKIIDFGLAKLTGRTMLTKTGSTLGTVAYMSPEQAQGRNVDQRTDIWAFGVILYEMLTGRPPFTGEYEQAMIYSIISKDPEPVTEFRPDVPLPLGHIVSRALEKDPDKRYPNMGELMNDMESLSAGVIPDSIQSRIRKAKLKARRKIILYGLTAAILISVIAALVLFTGQVQAIESIAILPLKNLTGDAGQQYFVDGITDELIGQLGRISGLERVISRTSIMRYKDTEKSLPEIARELNVDAIIEGTVYQIGENISIKLQLFDALPEERSIWTQRYDRPVSNVLVMYGEMAEAIAANIQVSLTTSEAERFAGAHQVNPRAYELYLKGMSHWYKLTPDDLETARQYFESALKEDPEYALAYTGISLVWIGLQQFGLVPPNEAVPKIKAAAQKAYELDEMSAEIHHIMALIQLASDWDWGTGKNEFLKAIELNPSHALARTYYSQLLAITGQSEEAIAQAQKALELDPLNSLVQAVSANTYAFTRRYDEAIVHAKNAIRTSPNDPVAHSILWEMYHCKGQYDEALPEAKAFFTGLGLNDIAGAMTLGNEKGGYPAAMKNAAETLVEFSKITFISPWFISFVYSVAGETEDALKWLERGYEIKDPNMPNMITPGFNILHKEPRYQELLKKMNIPRMND